MSKYLRRVAQTIEAKWRADLDPYTSDTVENAQSNDQNAITPPQLLNRLRETLKRVATFLPSRYSAQLIFNNIAAARKGNQWEDNPYFMEAQRIYTQLEYLAQQLPKGAAELGVKGNAIPILMNNLRVLMDGKNFGEYQHYTLLTAGEAPVIELDEEQNKKDLGF
jgi:hypothetical protein